MERLVLNIALLSAIAAVYGVVGDPLVPLILPLSSASAYKDSVGERSNVGRSDNGVSGLESIISNEKGSMFFNDDLVTVEVKNNLHAEQSMDTETRHYIHEIVLNSGMRRSMYVEESSVAVPHLKTIKYEGFDLDEGLQQKFEGHRSFEEYPVFFSGAPSCKHCHRKLPLNRLLRTSALQEDPVIHDGDTRDSGTEETMTREHDKTSSLKDNAPQGEFGFLRDDGYSRGVGQSSEIVLSSHDEGLLQNSNAGSSMVHEKFHDGVSSAGAGEVEDPMRVDVLRDDAEEGDADIWKQHDSRQSRNSEEFPTLKMEVDNSAPIDDDLTYIQKKRGVDTNSPQMHDDDEALRMEVGPSSAQLRSDDVSQTRSARSSSCSRNRQVCWDIANTFAAPYSVGELVGRRSMAGVAKNARETVSKNLDCCGGNCVDLLSNHFHCGVCDRPCLFHETCCNGKCTDLNTDSKNCGRCGHACPCSSPCEFGMCGYY